MRKRFGAMATFACALTLAACGSEGDSSSEGTIPESDGEAILDRLDELEQQVEEGECDAAEVTAGEIADAIRSLPPEVDGELRQTLVTASGRLAEQSRTQCEEEPEPEPEPPTGATGGEAVLEDEE